MTLAPVALPPGMWRNGTAYQAKARWYDGDLIRFYDGTVRPLGGWAAFSATAVSGTARAMIPWMDSASNFRLAVGTNTKLYVYDRAGARSDITPAGFTTGAVDSALAAGYGGGSYGTGVYGTTRGGSNILISAAIWTLDVLEQYLVGCTNVDGIIYKWDGVTADVAVVVDASAPVSNAAVMVTQEGFIFALGAGGDPRKIQWPNQDSFTDWTPTDVNQARDYSIQTPGEIMCGRRVRDSTVIFTTTDIHTATYRGLPDVYSFSMVADGCGIIAQQAHAGSENFCAWMSLKGFWQYDGTARAVDCDVADYVFGRLNYAQKAKVWALHNAAYGEVTWYYPYGTEIDSYVTWNYRENHWAFGNLIRTCGAPAGVYTQPLMVDASGAVWTHEGAPGYSGAATPYAETGPMEMGTSYGAQALDGGGGPGENVYDIVGMFPDTSTTGDVTVTFYSRFYPTGSETTSSTYTQANPTNVRVSGRQFRMRATSALTTDWRFGLPRLDIRLGGTR